MRVLCIQDERGPKLLRTHIKLPAGTNIADNTRRSGNLIAAVQRSGARGGELDPRPAEVLRTVGYIE